MHHPPLQFSRSLFGSLQPSPLKPQAPFTRHSLSHHVATNHSGNVYSGLLRSVPKDFWILFVPAIWKSMTSSLPRFYDLLDIEFARSCRLFQFFLLAARLLSISLDYQSISFCSLPISRSAKFSERYDSTIHEKDENYLN